jgi:hypothetical protein
MNLNPGLFGIAVLVFGTVLLGFGYHFSDTPLDQLSDTLIGRYTDNALWYVVVGIALMIGGGALTISGKRI